MGQTTNLNWLAGFLNHQQDCYLGVPGFESQTTNQPKPTQTISWANIFQNKNHQGQLLNCFTSRLFSGLPTSPPFQRHPGSCHGGGNPSVRCTTHGQRRDAGCGKLDVFLAAPFGNAPILQRDSHPTKKARKRRKLGDLLICNMWNPTFMVFFLLKYPLQNKDETSWKPKIGDL